MRLHRVVVHRLRRVGRVDDHLGGGQAGVEVAVRDVGREARVDLLGRVEAGVAGAELDVVRRGRVLDAHGGGRLLRGLERLGHHRGDELAAVGDVGGLEDAQLAVGDLGQPRGVLVGDDGEDALDRSCRR
jgi:hypothetical protein